MAPTIKVALRLRLEILLARWFCGDRRSGRIRFLPRGRIAKLGAFSHEVEAMEFVRQNTTIRVPKVYKAYGMHDGRQHFVMERLPGQPASRVVRDWTPEQTETFGRDLADVIRQLRALQPPPLPTGKVIGSARGGVNRDARLSSCPFGPFDSVTAFHTYLRFGRPLEHWKDREAVVKIHGRPEDTYAIKFAHADLEPQNIMVDDDAHIVRVIDWEFAGWYPEFWEYTKAFWSEMRPHWNNFYRAFEVQPDIQRYPDELACEVAIWMRMHSPFKYYDPPWQPGDEGTCRSTSGDNDDDDDNDTRRQSV
ncbi:hypothetical protein SCUCBS95973_005169 [Sporothrix curviconia]|uniref:Aminoglycoside phosphotransferase domain-containing protein n=1 Tax=Sporothrix curviconia TaxID=1260050 RepID=A0ABP0BVG7_9PEZI